MSLKIHNWNAELAKDENGKATNKVKMSFEIDDIGDSKKFVSIFQNAKNSIEAIEDGESLVDYMIPLTSLAYTIIKTLKKSK